MISCPKHAISRKIVELLIIENGAWQEHATTLQYLPEKTTGAKNVSRFKMILHRQQSPPVNCGRCNPKNMTGRVYPLKRGAVRKTLKCTMPWNLHFATVITGARQTELCWREWRNWHSHDRTAVVHLKLRKSCSSRSTCSTNLSDVLRAA
jgi:hypothetical protein